MRKNVRRLSLKDETKVTGRSRWFFYALIVPLPLWAAFGLVTSLVHGVGFSEAVNGAFSKFRDVSPVVFSFALALFSYYVLSIRAYNFNMKSALFHKERIIEFEMKILDELSGHIEESKVNQLYFLLLQYEHNLSKLEEVGFYPGKNGESDFYRENQRYIHEVVSSSVKESLGYYPEALSELIAKK